MKHRKSIIYCLIIFSFVCFVSSVLAAETKLDLKTIINKVDTLYRASTSYTLMKMTIQTPHWKRTMEMDAWTEGVKKTFIVLLSPKKDKGISTLRMDKEMWNYFPKINKVMKIPPSMMMNSWMGSDFTNDDLVKESTLLDDYDYSLLPNENNDADIISVKFIPKANTATVWGKIILQVRKSDFIPLIEEYYDEKGKKIREMKFKDVKNLGGRMIPATIEVIPLHKNGHLTSITYVKAKFNIPLKKDVFSLRNLKKRR